MAVGDRYILDEKEGRTYNRIDKKEEWEAANPVLEIGEIGIEKDGLLKNIKIGDGQTAWNALGYSFKQCPYEVGDIFTTLNATDPAARWPGTKWEAFAPGRVLIGAGTGTDSRGESRTFRIGDTGGEYQHQLTTGELASVRGKLKCPVPGMHGNYREGAITAEGWSNYGSQFASVASPNVSSGATMWGYGIAFGNDQAHNNLMPFGVIFCYKRVS